MIGIAKATAEMPAICLLQVSENTYMARPEGTRMGANGERLDAKRIRSRQHMHRNYYESQLKRKIREERFRKWACDHA